MSAACDHIVIVVPSLAQATADFAAAGFTVVAGGRHDAIPTENALIAFADGSYLELLAAREAAIRDELRALRESARWAGHLRGVSAVARRFLPHLAGPDGVADWALRSDSLSRQAARLRRLGRAASGPVAMRRERPGSEPIAWELLLPESALLPFWIADRTPRERRVPAGAGAVTHANGARGVSAVTVRAASVSGAALELSDVLDAMPRVRADGVTVLGLGGLDAELVEGEPAGASGVALAGCGALPESLRALGVSGSAQARGHA